MNLSLRHIAKELWNVKKTGNQTYGAFTHEKSTLFDKWCHATKDFAQLWKLVLEEEFKNCLPEKILVYLNEQKVSTLLQSAVGLLPFSDQTCCGWDLLVWGSKWVCCVCFFTPSSCLLPLFLGCFGYGLRTRLPVMGVDLILGNDFAGVKVFPSPEVVKSHGLYMWLALCCSQPSLCFSCVRRYARQGS